MAKPLCGRLRAPDPHPVKPTTRRQRQPSPTTAIRVDETSSRRRIGRTHPTHACLPVHKGAKSVRLGCGLPPTGKTLAASASYGNAIGVRLFGGCR